MTKNNDEWLEKHLEYLRKLKQPTEAQRLLILLAEKPDRNPSDEKKMQALIRAEKAAERYMKARAGVVKVLNAEKEAERKARDHELYQAAGLMILAGLLDSKTGKPIWDRAVLLGGLLELAEHKHPSDHERWKQKGAALLGGKAEPPPAPAPQAEPKPEPETQTQDASFTCPVCGRPLKRRESQYGPWWGCTGYPDCTYKTDDLDGKPKQG